MAVFAPFRRIHACEMRRRIHACHVSYEEEDTCMLPHTSGAETGSALLHLCHSSSRTSPAALEEEVAGLTALTAGTGTAMLPAASTVMAFLMSSSESALCFFDALSPP
jgi:hypothetical protein